MRWNPVRARMSKLGNDDSPSAMSSRYWSSTSPRPESCMYALIESRSSSDATGDTITSIDEAFISGTKLGDGSSSDPDRMMWRYLSNARRSSTCSASHLAANAPPDRFTGPNDTHTDPSPLGGSRL